MASCCYSEEYERFFDSREAARVVRRYLKHGLTGSAADLVESVAEAGMDVKTVIEVGGGAGQILADLLRRGEAAGVSIDMSPQWDGAAAELINKLQLTERIDRRTGDFVDMATDLPGGDVVIMHRVLCCYPHWDAMLDATLSLRPRVIAFTIPHERITMRGFAAVSNWLQKLRRRNFRVFIHPHGAMLDRLSAAGYQILADRSRPIWRTVALRATVLD